MKLRSQILLLLLVFGLAPLVASVVINFPLILDRVESIYHKAYLQVLQTEFRDLNQYLFSRNEMVRLLAKVPEPGMLMERQRRVPPMALQGARARYTDWINPILRDQPDIVQILFLDSAGEPRFWLERDEDNQLVAATGEPRDRPSEAFFEAGMRLNAGGFLGSNISVDRDADDPRHVMVLRLISPIIPYSGATPQGGLGAVVISIDVGGLSRAFRNTYWVQDDGNYLSRDGNTDMGASAFQDFPGLRAIFSRSPPEPDLWKGGGEDRVIWVPRFYTEQSGLLWVGRRVDPSPITTFLQALQLRVAVIVLALIAIVMVVAHWVALRVERFGRELTFGIGRVIKDNEPVRFAWRGPQEVTDLGQNLSRLAETHSRNTEALQAHAEELEASNRYKSEFLANVSHELRTPLNSILLLSKMLADSAEEQLSQEQRRQARVIHAASRDLRALIDDILDLSRIEARQTLFKLESIDLPVLLQGLADLVNPQADEKGLELNLEIDPDAPQVIESDVDKVRQILKNFLSNAVKFTHQGSVSVRLTRNVDSGDETCPCPVRIDVEDTGVGIPANQQEVIFEAFRQADGSTSRRFGGTGLGLTISRELAGLLGGWIELQSEPDEGSTFSLLLPLEFDRSSVDETQLQAGEEGLGGPDLEPFAEAITHGSVGEHEGRRILVVDSDVQNLLALLPLFERWGIRVSGAGDSAEALESLVDEGAPDLVLVDTGLPQGGGYETIVGIRAQERFRNLPVIALIPDEKQESVDRALAVGASECVATPIEPGALQALISRYLGTLTKDEPALEAEA